MSSELRKLRPFRGLSTAEDLLAKVLLQVGSEKFEAGDSVRLSPNEFLSSRVEIAFEAVTGDEIADAIVASAREAQLDVPDVSLLVVVRSSWLKISETRLKLSVEEIRAIGGVLEIANALDRPMGLMTPFGGAEVVVALCLNKQLERIPLKPWRPWTWLAKETFKITTGLGQLGFTPLPLTDESRNSLGLLPATLRYAEIEDATADIDKVDGIRLWVDSEILALLNLHPNSDASLTIQRQLFIDAMSGLAMKALATPNILTSPISELDDTLIGALLDMMAGTPLNENSESSRHGARAAIRHELYTDPPKFLGRLEAFIVGFARDMKRSIQG